MGEFLVSASRNREESCAKQEMIQRLVCVLLRARISAEDQRLMDARATNTASKLQSKEREDRSDRRP